MSDLNKIWSNSDCLSQEQLAHYLENKLDKEQTHLVESHLTDCQFCSDALEGLQMLPADEANNQINEIESEIEALLFNTQEDEKAVPIAKTITAKPTSKLTSSKGGKTISWRAAAGLFLLIFGGGLAVFSYVNNNTDWLKSGNQQLAKSEKSSKKEFDLETKKSSGKELETLSLDPDEFEENAAKFTEESSNKKNKEFQKTPPAVSAKQALVSRADKAPQASNAAPPALSTPKPQPASTVGDTKFESEKEIVAKVDRAAEKAISTEDFAAGSQNTYTRPEFKGKMKNKKDMDQEPVVAASELSKKTAQTSRYKKSKKLAEIDVVQREGLGNQTGYNIDNFSQGFYAFNKADYKTSIKFFKKALKEKDLKNREETMYYLALAYEKTKAISKAEKLYTSLLTSKLYNAKAQQRLKSLKTKTKK